MSYHKKNLKEQLADIAFEYCEEISWQNINMRLIAKEAKVSTTAFYRHYKNKNDLMAEVMRKGYQLLNKDMKDIHMDKEGFVAYGAQYIKFGLEHPHIYDLIFGSPDIDRKLYPDLQKASHMAFNRLVDGVRSFMPDNSEKEIMIKAYQIWASVHGIVGILRHSEKVGNNTGTLKWIKNNLEGYLKMTTFS